MDKAVAAFPYWLHFGRPGVESTSLRFLSRDFPGFQFSICSLAGTRHLCIARTRATPACTHHVSRAVSFIIAGQTCHLHVAPVLVSVRRENV